MVQIFIRNPENNRLHNVEVDSDSSFDELKDLVSSTIGLPSSVYDFVANGRRLDGPKGENNTIEQLVYDGFTVHPTLRLCGGIDFQHREGSKIGSGGHLSEANAAVERKERLRKLALETIDISKDPYFMRNHLGTYECKLCLTLHTNEGNYLAHTQGKRHQYNLGRRAAMEAKNAAPRTMAIKEDVAKRHVIKIGRPGYKVTKSRDPASNQRSLTFEVDYPEAEDGFQPRHRFMSAYEQKVEPPDKNFQYLLFACDPYEIIAFKIPNEPIDKREGRFFSHWDVNGKKFVLQLYFNSELS